MSGEFSHVPKAPSCSESSEKNNHAESDSDDIISDPRLQKAIEDFDVGIRDQVRREYLAKGLYQLIGLNFLQKEYMHFIFNIIFSRQVMEVRQENMHSLKQDIIIGKKNIG